MLPDVTWKQARSHSYPSDLSDEQWKMIQRLIPRSKKLGRKRRTSMRAVVNAIFYIIRTGCAWRYLPCPFPPWQTVYDYFSQWKELGVFKKIHDYLRGLCRKKERRTKNAHVLLIDSQSVKCQFGEARGWDGFKKVRGRKRHIIGDTLGLLHAQWISPAQEKDHEGALHMLSVRKEAWQNMQELYADGSYRVKKFFQYLGEKFGVTPTYNVTNMTRTDERSRRSGKVIYSNLKPKRWIIERTFAWFNHYRRLTRDYEKTLTSSQSVIQIAMIQIMLNRLLPTPASETYWRSH